MCSKSTSAKSHREDVDEVDVEDEVATMPRVVAAMRVDENATRVGALGTLPTRALALTSPAFPADR